MPATDPADLVNQAIDLLPGAQSISEIRDGSKEANAALRHYQPRIRDLLRAAHWNFSRKQITLDIAKDSTGQTTNVPTNVPQPWVYEYLYPDDCEKLRFIPQTGTDNSITPQLMTNLAPAATISGVAPAPYVIGTDVIVPNDQSEGAGVTVILCNIVNAQAVYTARVLNPDLWDAQFSAAYVGLLAAWMAVPCVDDKSLALKVRAEQIAIVKDLIAQARVTNGNEDWSSQDHMPDWLRIRGAGRWPFGLIGANPIGLAWVSWESLSFPDGSFF